jgi:hypothetical protein
MRDYFNLEPFTFPPSLSPERVEALVGLYATAQIIDLGVGKVFEF